MSEWRRAGGAGGAGAADGGDADGSGSGSNENRGFNKVEVKRINYDTLQTSLPEAQMRGKQVIRFWFVCWFFGVRCLLFFFSFCRY